MLQIFLFFSAQSNAQCKPLRISGKILLVLDLQSIPAFEQKLTILAHNTLADPLSKKGENSREFQADRIICSVWIASMGEKRNASLACHFFKPLIRKTRHLLPNETLELDTPRFL